MNSTRYIYIAGYKPNENESIADKVITWFTFSRFKHVSLVFDMVDHGLEYESTSRHGVHKQNFVPSDNIELVRVRVTAKQEEWAIKLLESVKGAKYDHTGIWGFWVRKKRENPDKWFCSELVAWVCTTIGKALQRLKAFQHTPGMCMCSTTGEPCEVPVAWLKDSGDK